ncbi:MAG: FRG domain-containing protein [Promethearchaeota archaeon]
MSRETWTPRRYAELTLRCQPEIESFSGRSWDLPNWQELAEDFPNYDEDPIGISIPEHWYRYWVYLRHYGFPSPLLDWTESENIAAFFAFDGLKSTLPAEISDQEVAVYAFVELPRGGKTGGGGLPLISSLGPYVRTHKRHFVQQSWYTVCVQFIDGEHVFVLHERVMGRGRLYQDKLVKFTLPALDRCEALKGLQRMNITRYTLFQTEEALMTTLAFNRIEKRAWELKNLMDVNELG